MTTAIVDTNVMVRFLTVDDPAKASAVAKLLTSAASGDIALTIPSSVFAEIVFVLERIYGWSRSDTAGKLDPLFGLAGVSVDDATIMRIALRLHGQHNISFTHAVVAAVGLERGIPLVYSYDKDIGRVAGIKRLEP